MADAELAASLQLLNGILAYFSKNSNVNVSFARHAFLSLLSRPLFGVTAGGPGEQQQLVSDACIKLYNTVGKLVPKGSVSEQALVIQVLAACIQSCDPVILIESLVGWGGQLAEAIKRSGAGAGPAAGASGAAAAPAAPTAASAGAAALAQAACAAAAVLFGRVQPHIELPGVRREVTSIVPKLLPQVLSLLQSAQQLPSSCVVAALQLLAALLQVAPSALRSTATAVERALQHIVLAAAASTGSPNLPAALVAAQQQVLVQTAVCVALLPAVQGDAASWSETARKLLSSSHDVLDYLLLGLESRPSDPHYRSYLAPAGTDVQRNQQLQQPAATGADRATGWLPCLPWHEQQQQQGTSASTAASRRQTTPATMLLSMLIAALQHLVQQPFAVPVPLPGYSLALLAARLLQFDAGAAVASGAVAGSSSMYQEVLVLQPQLQQAGWHLLQLVVDAAGQQLQLQGLLLRVVRQGLRGVQMSGQAALLSSPASVRCCIYSTASQLLRATGLAGVRALAAEAMGCIVLELYAASAATTKAAGGVLLGGSTGGHRPNKRAKVAGGASGNAFEQFDSVACAAAMTAGDDVHRMAVASSADMAAQSAALQLLRAMLEAGGQLLPADVRAHADAVAYHIAQTATAVALRLHQQPAVCSVANGSSSSALGSLQVSAYQALLASILVPCGHRPPFLSQAALLFRQGRSSSNPAVAAMCQGAAIQCESLLHPRATPMSSMRQYTGMDALRPLTKPHMWSAADAAVGQASIAGTSQDRPVCQGAEDTGPQPVQLRTEQQGAHAAGASSAAAAPPPPMASVTGTNGLVLGCPVNLPSAQQQQQQLLLLQQLQQQLQQFQQLLQQQQQLLPGTLAPVRADAGASPKNSDPRLITNTPAAAPGSAAMDVDRPQQQQTTALLQKGRQFPPISLEPSSVGKYTNPQSPQSSVLVADSAAGAAEAAAAAAVSAAAAPLVTSLLAPVVGKAGTVAFNEESSDSEGPLPDIDSGVCSSDEEED